MKTNLDEIDFNELYKAWENAKILGLTNIKTMQKAFVILFLRQDVLAKLYLSC